jgi:soluble lytic murein transglycosylase
MIMKRLITGLLALLLAACTLGPTPLAPTATPNPTLPPGVTPTDTPSPTSTPSPTPIPEVRLKTGDLALFNGDYTRAQSEYQIALSTAADSETRAAALWGLGQVEYVVGNNNGKALQDLWNLAGSYPESPNAVRAYFIMGEIYMKLERYTEAAEAFTTYLALRPGVIDYYVQELRGDAYIAAKNYAEAIPAYQAALAAPHLGDDTALQIKIAQVYATSGDTATALEIYDAIASGESNDYVKAEVDLLSGQLYLSLGQTDLAYQRFSHAVDNYPTSYDSYSALVALVNAGVTVDQMNRGLVDYFAKQYGYAIDAFRRYIAANPENDGTANYYIAMALNKMGNSQEAIDEFTFFIDNFPENRPRWQTAWEEKASIQSAVLFQYDAATQTLLTFVQQAPADEYAPTYLMQAARNQERDGKLEEAAQTWERVADEYPSSELVPQALFWAGIVRYRNQEYKQALVTFQRDVIFSTSVGDQARAFFWVGKTQLATGDTASAQAAWQQAASLDPTDYYSLRAQDMLFNRPAFDPLPAVNLAVNLTAERTEAEAWLRVTFNLPTDTDLSTPGALLADPRLIRGTEFLTLGLDAQARLEFDALSIAVEQDPADCYRLANYLLALRLYYPAIFAIRQVLTLAGMNTQSQTLAAPSYFNHVRYGLYYQELVGSAAQQYGFDPLFLWSVMRQESLFNKYAVSNEEALGLMQIWPPTGQFIVDNLGWPPNYTSEDLYRPMVSVGLGTSWLMDQRIRFNGELFTTLASYNGGQNAAPIWRDLPGPDPDLFVEVVRSEETRNYIRSIYENYSMYRSLYGTMP